MPFVPVPLVAQVELILSDGQSIMENVLYFRGSVEWNVTTLTGLADDVITWWDTEVAAHVASNIALEKVVATSLVTATAPQVERTAGLPIAGTNTDPVAPNNVTMAVTFITANRGRSFRGRNYFIGIVKTGVSGDSVVSGYCGNIVAAYGFLSTDVTENGATHVVVSRITNGVERSTGIATDVIDYESDCIVDSQRRRLRGRGQ